MKTVTVYSSAPLSTPLCIAFYKLSCLGLRVVLKPFSELPIPQPPRRRATLRAELEEVCLELAAIGERLNLHHEGTWHLGKAAEQALLTKREELQAHKRGLISQLNALKSWAQ